MLKQENLIVPTVAALYALQNHIEGECVYCEEDKKVYCWSEYDGWGPINFENKGVSYENRYRNCKRSENAPHYRRCAYLRNPGRGARALRKIQKKIELFEELKATSMKLHYMLLCKDYNYYTIFEDDSMLNMPNFGVAVSEIITNLGKVISIDFTESKDAIEIWLIPDGEESAFAFYLFPYDAGVVYYG